MGLAASQGRLLLLTARKSDLEYRAQEISQRRLLLATELESVSARYARQTANRQMKLTRKVDQGEANQTSTVNLTYKALIEHGRRASGSSSTYRIRNAHGEVAVSDSSELPTSAASAGYPGLSFSRVNSNSVRIAGTDKDGKEVNLTFVVDKRLQDASETDNYFQEGLRNGAFIIEQFGTINPDGSENASNETGDAIGKWRPVGWSGMTEIQDNYYTDDDATAQGAYQTATARVQAQDKKLETDQKQIETQHKAVETEFESVSKVIQNNIENSFKMFS